MNIWIDGYEANTKQRLGSSQIAFEILRNLEKIDKKNEYTILLPSEPMEDMPKERRGWVYKQLRPSRLWTRIALPIALYRAKPKPDVIFSPTHYIPRFSPVKRVGIIFDLSYLHFPEFFQKGDLWQLTNWSKYSILNADHIITISNFTKQDIIKQYGISREKITAVHPGYNSDIFRPVKNDSKIKKVQDKYKISEKYLIFIGTIQPRKNLLRLIESFSKIDDLQLVIIGKSSGEGRQGWMYGDILRRPQELDIEERIIFTGFIPNEDLVCLLNGAVAFILPSLWEGFGIPVVEAMACGVPVIVSNVSSLPEVVGKAGLLIDPKSVNQIEQSIRLISTDTKLRLNKSKQGLEQAKKFSWVKMAKSVLKVLEGVN